jgi:hypothetical protein
VLDHPRLWRVTAALSALLLGGLVFVCAQGSPTIIAHKPATDGQHAAAPSWEPWCTRGIPRKERERLAFCARVEGRVLTSTHGPAAGEAHVVVISDFHIVVVRLPTWAATPDRGANIVAVGPLFRVAKPHCKQSLPSLPAPRRPCSTRARRSSMTAMLHMAKSGFSLTSRTAR